MFSMPIPTTRDELTRAPREHSPAVQTDRITQASFGRYREMPLSEMSPEQRAGYDQIMRERGICPGPYKIWVENAPLMNLLVPIGTYYWKHSSLNDTEREIATVLIVAKWGAAYAVGEHEWIAESTGGYSAAAIPSEKVERMIIGLPVEFADPRQQAVYEVSRALIHSRYVPKSLYQRAVTVLGNVGVTDLTVLLGYFSMVAFTLMFHDVPSGAEGMAR
jgi:4-carboxymuconolactone decarboxylase